MDLYGGKLPDYLFTVWFAHRIRRVAMVNWPRNSDGLALESDPLILYANHISQPVELVRRILDGDEQPTNSVLDDMQIDWVPNSGGYYRSRRLE